MFKVSNSVPLMPWGSSLIVVENTEWKYLFRSQQLKFPHHINFFTTPYHFFQHLSIFSTRFNFFPHHIIMFFTSYHFFFTPYQFFSTPYQFLHHITLAHQRNMAPRDVRTDLHMGQYHGKTRVSLSDGRQKKIQPGFVYTKKSFLIFEKKSTEIRLYSKFSNLFWTKWNLLTQSDSD